MLACLSITRENRTMTTHSELTAMFQNIDSAIQYDLATEEVTSVMRAGDLVGVATLANHAQRNDILHVIYDAACNKYEAAHQGTRDERLYLAIGNVVSCLLYVNRDERFPESPAITQTDMRLYRASKPKY